MSSAQRKNANYQASLWNYEHLQSLQTHHQVEECTDQSKKLEEEVRLIINDKSVELIRTLELVDDIGRMGIGYRFVDDIQKVLDETLEVLNNEKRDNSLYSTSLSFRLLRENGYEVSQDVFSKFKDQNNNFKSTHTKDVKGLITLYEASYYAYEKENHLDNGKTFTTKHLEEIIRSSSTSQSVKHQVIQALDVPLNRRVKMLEAISSITAYKNREDCKQVVLELAVLDFNLAQSVQQRDIRDMSSWWIEIGLASKLSFARDRLMECFFWTVGLGYEPEFSRCRRGLTKVAALLTSLDDIYDLYGTLEELELFTDAIQRWDVSCLENLPDYMKLFYVTLYDTINEILGKDEQIILPYLTKAWSDLCKSFLREAKWSYDKSRPTFEEYMENGWVSSSGPLFLIHAYFLLSEHHSETEANNFVENNPNLIKFPSTICRLYNDNATGMAEVERGETTNAIQIYMSEVGVSKEIAKGYIHDLIEEIWKKMNKGIFENTTFTTHFGQIAINLARIAQCHYQYGDGHGKPDERSKKRIESLILEPISLF